MFTKESPKSTTESEKEREIERYTISQSLILFADYKKKVGRLCLSVTHKNKREWLVETQKILTLDRVQINTAGVKNGQKGRCKY